MVGCIHEVSDTGSIEIVSFWEVGLGALKLRFSAGAVDDGDASRLERVGDFPTDAVDGSGIFESRFCVLGSGYYFFSEVRIFDVIGVLLALLGVAGRASEGQVADAVGASQRFRKDMFDLEWRIFRTAIRAFAAVLLQQILANLVAVQRALLILDALYFGVIHQLGIEPDQFKRETIDRIDLAQPVDPSFDVVDARHQAWWHPTVRTGAVQKAGLPIAEVTGPPTTTETRTGLKILFDRLASVLKLSSEDDVAIRIDDSDPSRF